MWFSVYPFIFILRYHKSMVPALYNIYHTQLIVMGTQAWCATLD